MGKTGPTTTYDDSLGERPARLGLVVDGAAVERRGVGAGRGAAAGRWRPTPSVRARSAWPFTRSRDGGPRETRQEATEQVRDLGLRQVALSDLDEADAAGDRRLHDLDQVASLRSRADRSRA